ncbi:MAG TPA: TonB-dependent siderophore receptor [Vicinamibacterales bacterium]|nr:TonB-dependent siderophore receptor [Vicinamibacterales bacterium]
MRTLFSALLVVIVLAPAVWAADPEPAQSAARMVSIEGRILDPMQMGIAGARVTATSVDRGAEVATTTSDQTGAFTIAVPVGRYTVKASAPGFVDASLPVTADGTSSTSATRFVLQIAGFQEKVKVTAPGGYQVPAIASATKTMTPLRDVPQSVTVVTHELIKDQMMMSMGDVMRYVPGITVHQGENNRDQVIIRGNSSSADFFMNGVRDDVQYYRDLYNLDRVEVLKGPNALIFGRGGAGGVVNRVTKDAGFMPVRELSLQAGTFDNRRFTMDVGQPLNGKVAVRLNGLYENSDSFRDFVGIERYGVTPSVTVNASDRTKVSFRYEYLHDSRGADRGITSFQGAPADVDRSTFYGNPNLSDVRADVNIGSATIEHEFNGFTLRNTTALANYDRFYQNFVPGAVTPDKSQVTLTAYNNATDRTNLFNQTDATMIAHTGGLRHTVLAGAEFGHQLTDNFRNTGFFNNTVTSILAPYSAPTISTPVTFRQSTTDADNHVVANVAAAYVQDQIDLSSHVLALAGVRFDRFELDYHDNRANLTRQRADNLVSPRAGLVYKPIVPVSIYTSYSVSYLPGSGDQFSSLTNITEQLKPEQFTSYEVGGKWDARPGLSLTTAVYRLDRTNTRSTDPNDPTRIVQTGSQRTNGFELGANGYVTMRWSVAGGYAYQDAYVSQATASAVSGARVGQVPQHTFSLWNNYQLLPKVGAALGVVHRSDMFAAIDNAVTLPGYTRADAAAFFTVTRQLRFQVNVENLFDKKYFVNADSNTNISPGFPRAVRVGLTTNF